MPWRADTVLPDRQVLSSSQPRENLLAARSIGGEMSARAQMFCDMVGVRFHGRAYGWIDVVVTVPKLDGVVATKTRRRRRSTRLVDAVVAVPDWSTSSPYLIGRRRHRLTQSVDVVVTVPDRYDVVVTVSKPDGVVAVPDRSTPSPYLIGRRRRRTRSVDVITAPDWSTPSSPYPIGRSRHHRTKVPNPSTLSSPHRNPIGCRRT